MPSNPRRIVYSLKLIAYIRAEDIVILVTGLTGSGKTSFINLLADRQSGVGTGLHSNSSIIQVVSCTLDDNDKNKVYLVDMQALDDEGPSDVEVLREVASWLKNSNLKLTGMLYLHPISAPRLHGKTTNNLRIFRKIYGDNALSNVIIVTTMWDIIQDVEVGDARETELISRDEFFRPWIASGSQVSRHNNTKVSASDIVHNLLGKQQTTLEIQYEMLHLGKQLKETKAGLELADVWERNRQNYLRELLRYESELEVARAKQEHELITDLEVAFITIEKKIQRLDSKVELLEVDAYQLHKERDDKESTEQRRIGQSDTAVDTPTEKVDEIAAGMHHSNEDGVKEKLKAEPSANVAESHRERPTENPVTKQDPIREIGRDDQMILVAGDTANSRWEFIKLAKRDGEELHTYSLPPYSISPAVPYRSELIRKCRGR
ncbi:hypothetical protein BDV95DRAFT_492003 [Massariosphaeria phaeospora]|uniref:P-loop containing nucleoside triphosphate hydrolase protein n=1 Tax=Massariosphaeria phaeospora TaxID=100035 RepID=A0A7C8I7S0_9PLEO|nr:hypothetical protein BDV95DRAFT_492003 [Massariosphaeria phaeospora]